MRAGPGRTVLWVVCFRMESMIQPCHILSSRTYSWICAFPCDEMDAEILAELWFGGPLALVPEKSVVMRKPHQIGRHSSACSRTEEKGAFRGAEHRKELRVGSLCQQCQRVARLRQPDCENLELRGSIRTAARIFLGRYVSLMRRVWTAHP